MNLSFCANIDRKEVIRKKTRFRKKDWLGEVGPDMAPSDSQAWIDSLVMDDNLRHSRLAYGAHRAHLLFASQPLHKNKRNTRASSSDMSVLNIIILYVD